MLPEPPLPVAGPSRYRIVQNTGHGPPRTDRPLHGKALPRERSSDYRLSRPPQRWPKWTVQSCPICEMLPGNSEEELKTSRILIGKRLNGSKEKGTRKWRVGS